MQQPPEQSEGPPNLVNLQAPDSGNGRFDGETPTVERLDDWTNLAQLLLLTFVGSAIIVLYVAFVNIFTIHRKETDVVENAALTAARELAEVSVQHANFGDVGLCDLPAGRYVKHGTIRTRTIGIDRLFSTLKVDEVVAQKLHHPRIQTLVQADFATASALEKELALRLRQAVESDASQTKVKLPTGNEIVEEQDNSVYRDVYKVIVSGRDAQQSSGVELKIKLGRAKSAILTRDCDVHLVDPNVFVETNDDKAPYLVMVETVYDKRTKTGTEKVETRRCAIVAAPNVEPPASAFVINFPSGLPPHFSKPKDILFYDGWKTNGDWQQAVGSEVPGKGSLAPPLGSVMPRMSPGDATAVALYDWLKGAGPSVDPYRTLELLDNAWDLTPLMVTPRRQDANSRAEPLAFVVNSCLARDTGAREYSIMNQTGPGSTGQTALSRAFSINDQSGPGLPQPLFPQSSLPLFVSSDGNCNVAGREGFDHYLVQDYLTALHDTNLAAIASLATAKQMIAAARTALSQLQQKMYIEQQELSSVTYRLSRLEDEARKRTPQQAGSAKAHDQDRMIELGKQHIATLNAIIEADDRQRTKYNNANRLALLSTFNANKVANSTFELGAHAFKLCRNGIYRIELPFQGFLIGKKFVFLPTTKPLSEGDFMATEAGPGNPRGRVVSPWFATNMDAVFSIESAFPDRSKVRIDGRSMNEFLSLPPPNQSCAVGMVVLDSRTLMASAEGKPVCQTYRQYAFPNIPVPQGQLLYYCQNAVQTGGRPRVSWSVILRDLVASKATVPGQEPSGNPTPSPEGEWCHQPGKGCPGLACELQIRTPLPVLDKFVEDAYLKNAAMNAQVPQIPPVPPDML